jgi:hypothetical protein
MPAKAKHHQQPEKPIVIADKPAAHAQANPEEPVEPMTRWGKETHSEAEQGRAHLSAALRDMNDHDVIRLRDFHRVVEANESNSLTPIEHFIVDLPLRWKREAKWGQGLTPDDIVELVNSPDGPRSWFEEAVQITRFFNKWYPRVIAQEVLPEEAR